MELTKVVAPSKFTEVPIIHLMSADLDRSKGMSLQMKDRFPLMSFIRADRQLRIGDVIPLWESTEQPVTIFNLIVRDTLEESATMSNLEAALRNLTTIAQHHQIKKLSLQMQEIEDIQLTWGKTKILLEKVFEDAGLSLSILAFPYASREVDKLGRR